MKKIVSGIVIIILLAVGALFFYKSAENSQADFAQLVILTLVVGFAIFISYKKIVSFKKGEPDKDELSQLLLQKAAATAFYTSLYMWLIISYLNGRGEAEMETEQLIGFGIIGMAILFAGFWLFYKIKGVKND